MVDNILSLTIEELVLLSKIMGTNGNRHNIGLIPYVARDAHNQEELNNFLFKNPNAPLAEYKDLFNWLIEDNAYGYVDFDFASLLYILFLKYNLGLTELLYIILSQLVNYTFRDEENKEAYYEDIYVHYLGEKNIDYDYTVNECTFVLESLHGMDNKEYSSIDVSDILDACIRKQLAVEDYIAYNEIHSDGNWRNYMERVSEFTILIKSIKSLLGDNILRDTTLSKLSSIYLRLQI